MASAASLKIRTKLLNGGFGGKNGLTSMEQYLPVIIRASSLTVMSSPKSVSRHSSYDPSELKVPCKIPPGTLPLASSTIKKSSLAIDLNELKN